MNKEKIILIGGGGHCKACIDIIELLDIYQILGILDEQEKVGEEILGYSIIGTDNDINKLKKKTQNFFITLGQIGKSEKRLKIYQYLKKLSCTLPTIISPTAYISKHAEIGEGSIIMHHVAINAGAKIGVNNIINSKALIEHDAIIEDHCHISTGSIVNGGVRVGSKTFFGSGAVSKQYITIPPGSFIKANSIVK